MLTQQLEAAWETNDELTARLAERSEQLRVVHQEREHLSARVEHLEHLASSRSPLERRRAIGDE